MIPKRYYQAFSISLQQYDEANAWGYIFNLIQAHSEKEVNDKKYTFDVALKRINESRNRYKNVLPFDHSRVEITPYDSNPDGYINSSKVVDEEAKRNYILCQGPCENTCSDFWQMVWEQKCSAIIMLNKLIEGGAWKCHDYFPSSDNKEQTYGNWKVLLKEEKHINSLIHRTIDLENISTKEVRTVNHIQYTSWPDFDVPPSTKCFLHLLKYVRDLNVLSNELTDPPCVVHCSAGIGRSGSFVFVDSFLRRAELNVELDIDIPEHLLNLRRQRPGLIQTPAQLRFAWLAVIDAIKEKYGLTIDDLIGEDENETEQDVPSIDSEKELKNIEATKRKKREEEELITSKSSEKIQVDKEDEIDSTRSKRREMIARMVEKSRTTESSNFHSWNNSNFKMSLSIGAAVAVAAAAYYFSKS